LGFFDTDSSGVRSKDGKNTTWFYRGVVVALIAHSWMAVGDLKLERGPVWSESVEVVELADMPLTEVKPLLAEFELEDNSSHWDGEAPSTQSEQTVPVPSITVVEKVDTPTAGGPVQGDVDSRVAHESVVVVNESATSAPSVAERTPEPSGLSDIPVEFPSDVPMSEVLRVSKTFQGLIQENLRSGPYVLAERFAGSVSFDSSGSNTLAALETEEIDESEAELGFTIGQDVDETVETVGLDPFKTYTVVNGRIRAVSPAKIQQEYVSAESALSERAGSVVMQEPSGQPQVAATSEASKGVRISNNAKGETPSTPSEDQAITLSKEELDRGMAEVTPSSGVASLDASPAAAQYVTVSGTVRVPEGFARNKVVLRLAGTSYQVQTDAAGHFELRDVPKGTRFELLVWHLDGGLTRRLVPVSASGRDEALDLELVQTSYVDSLAKSFGLVQQMNLGGFCARVEVENPTVLVGASVYANTAKKNLSAHFFSEKGLPAMAQTELTPDGRFCVFNVDESLVDIRLVTLNGVRRQFVVHLEPSTFEHDLILDASQSFYRKVSLLEPLDTREVIELSVRGVQPEFGDKRLRNWIFGEDTPVWTKVSNYVLRSDESYAAVRPQPHDLQFFPGGQKFIEVKVAPDIPGAPWGRILVSRDELMTDGMLKRAKESGGRVYQDRKTPVSFAALDADAWEEITADNHDVPAIVNSDLGGLYLSIDTSALGRSSDEMEVSLRDTWSGESVCEIQRINAASTVKSSRFYRAACSAENGQYALIVQSQEGALLWSDVVRIRKGTVQTVTIMDPHL